MATKRKEPEPGKVQPEQVPAKIPRVPGPLTDDKYRAATAYVSLTTHPGLTGVTPIPIKWGARDPAERGPVLASSSNPGVRNAIGAYGGSYSVYRALAVASGSLDPSYVPDYTHTHPPAEIPPSPSWFEEDKIVTLDPFGHIAQTVFAAHREKGYDVRPTIAVTKAHMDIAEITNMVKDGSLKPDGTVLLPTGQINVTKAAVEPVWYLPGLAKRFNTDEHTLRRHLFQQTNGMYPELLTRSDLKVFLPPIGGLTVYVFGNPDDLRNPEKTLAVRVHDECNGSDVFGSDICTCRPYLVHGIEVCLRTAAEGGVGLIVYFRKEGRALGEVTKYLVYNRRKRQEGGDRAEMYFNCTACVAGVEDSRFQSTMPDALHWLGITKIHRLVSMSDMKYNAITSSGIEVVQRIPIPKDRIPEDAHVEIDAKVFAGYHGGSEYEVHEEDLKASKGRIYKEHMEGKEVEPGGGDKRGSNASGKAGGDLGGGRCLAPTSPWPPAIAAASSPAARRRRGRAAAVC
eukprot:CAMPEP_0196771906 /NCGR_PEP_ID=MMETSP1104-20130614/1943_1 /TAXON_ID=33652 /ORGANISM="Cafeteria sp., Strain Caron Lab Isolate" /LENGTH=512 /DNA_ID=CAMNT_0042142037 /DNA_START=39 /DNA_END=1578 /DNA_ORIENTATION=-